MSFDILEKIVVPEVVTKSVRYFGLDLEVTLCINYIATDLNGWVYGYTERPDIYADNWQSSKGLPTYCCHVYYSGNFEDSLVCLQGDTE